LRTFSNDRAPDCRNERLLMPDISLRDNNKSTNGRSFYWYLAPLRGLFRIFCAVAPNSAARVALRLFRTPHRHATPLREKSWMKTAEKFVFEVGGERLTAWSWGSGPTVLLVHGWEGRGSQMGAFAQPLVDAGFRAITVDGPGHGVSSSRRSSVPQFAEAIAVLVERMGPVHGIVAHSFGSAATGWAARQATLADRLVFVAPPGDLDRYVTFFADLLGLSPKVRLRMVSLLERRFNLHWAEIRYATMTPVDGTDLLVIQDRDDKESPFSNGIEVSSAWPGSRLHTTTGLGHRRVLRHPDVIEQVVEFLTAAPVAMTERPTLPHPVGNKTGSVSAVAPA